MKKIYMLIILTFTLFIATSCAKSSDSGCQFNNDDTLKVCATLFAQYDFAKQIGGDLVEVKLLLQPGVEPHSYEPTAKDIIHLNKADLFIYTNSQMEPWVVNNLFNTIENDELVFLNVSQNITMIESNHEAHAEDDVHDEEEDEHNEEGLDPHVWTSIKNAIIMIDTILTQFIELDPQNEETYKSNALAYKNQLSLVDVQFETLFSNSTSKTIVHGGHAALGYFAHDYGLEIESVFTSLSPNEELMIDNIVHIIDILKAQETPILYHEELIDAKAARMIQTELKSQGVDVELRLLHGLHNVTKEELKNNITYLDLLMQNLNNLKAGFKANE